MEHRRNAPKRQTFREADGAPSKVRRGSCSLGLDCRSTAGARSADLDSRSSANLDAALAGGFRRVTSDEGKVE